MDPATESTPAPTGATAPAASPAERSSSGDAGLRYYGASRGWSLPDFRELWEYRDLIGVLALRDLQVRYRQTIVGVMWAVIQPLAQLAIFVTMFGLLGRNPSESDVPYPLVVLAGLLPWQLFASSLTHATESLVTNQQLITKVYFPKLALPIASVAGAIVDFAVSLMLLAGLLLYYGAAPRASWLLLPLLVVLIVVAAVGAGSFLSAMNAMYRDIGYVVPFVIQVGFFVSPVVYETAALIPSQYRPLYALNPLVAPLESIRWALLGTPLPPFGEIAISLVSLGVVLFGGLLYFRRIERLVADRI